MTRYFATSAATRKNRPLTTGMTDVAKAREQVEFIATYGGVAKLTNNRGEVLAKFSIAKGWH